MSDVAAAGTSAPNASFGANPESAPEDVRPEVAPVELVFGLVGPIGVDLPAVRQALNRQLRLAGYHAFEIRLSDLIQDFYGKDGNHVNEFVRIDSLIKDGNTLCNDSGRADIIARMGLIAVREYRESITKNKNYPDLTKPIAYIVSSLKRKEEVELFRNTYGKAFTLISVYASTTSRMQSLTKRFRGCEKDDIPDFIHGAKPEELAAHIIRRDYREEEEAFGQRVGKAFPMADYFVTTEPRRTLEPQLKRLVRLTLGDPYISPTKEEQGMFFAQAAALRSLDLSRQVGAAIVSGDGDVLATGCNEVPKPGGGLYWAEDPDCARDLEFGEDANIAVKAELVQDAIWHLRDKEWLAPEIAKLTDKQLADQMLVGKTGFFRSSKLYDVIEFGRAVHAEMAAITQAARIGVSIGKAKLFSTTFPCHICARHIVACGISDVFFIEPYDKSRAEELHSDSISVEPHEASSIRTNFRAFVGAAPRRYMDFFQLSGERKSEDGKIVDLPTSEMRPKFKRFMFLYINLEERFVGEATQSLKDAKDKFNIRGSKPTPAEDE